MYGGLVDNRQRYTNIIYVVQWTSILHKRWIKVPHTHTHTLNSVEWLNDSK